MKDHHFEIAEVDHGPGDTRGGLYLTGGPTVLVFDDPISLPVPYDDVPPCLQVSVAGSLGFHMFLLVLNGLWRKIAPKEGLTILFQLLVNYLP